MEKLKFASPEWIDMTRSYLEDAVGKLPAEAHGVKYEYCASLSDPPEDLDDGTGKVAYWFSIDVPDVEVGTGERDDLGAVNRGDYQASLAHTRAFMDFSDPEFVARREAGRRAELDAGKSIPDEAPPELLALLGDLHNYRAQRTA